MAQVKNDFSQGSIPRNILSLALPMTAAQLVNVLYSVVDRIYLGRLPGSSHLALTGLGSYYPHRVYHHGAGQSLRYRRRSAVFHLSGKRR